VTAGVTERGARAGTRRALVHTPLALLLLCVLASRARAQAVPARFEQGIFELRAARIAAETVPGLLAASGTVLIPIERVIALTGVPAQRTDSSITLERARGAGAATLQLRGRWLVDSSGVSALGADELALVDGTYYLATARVADWLGATVQTDLGQLSVTMTRTPPFPVEQAAARAQRTAGGLRRGTRSPSGPSVPFVPRSGGAVLDWTASAVGTGRSLGGSSGAMRSAAALFGGDVTAGVGVSGDGTGGVRSGNAEWSYRRGLPGNDYLRQFQIGDILGGGTQLRSLRGFTVTNARLASDPSFGSVPVNLSLPQGWQYEVYQDGQLIGFSDAGVRAPVYVPLRYGTTPVQVRLVGPTGDETVRDFSYLIPQTQQQPGRLEYTAGGGRCTSACSSIAFGDASYGVTPWLSVSGGAERRTTDGLSRTLPEGALSVATYSGWNAQLQAAKQSFTRVSLLYGGSARVIGSGSYSRTWLGADQPSVLVAADDGRWLFDGQLQLRTGPEGRVSGWRLDNTLEGVASQRAERSRSALTAELRGGSVSLSYETDRSRALREAGVSLLAVIPPRLRAGSVLATVLFDEQSAHAVELSTSLQTGRRGAAAVTTRWQRGTGVLVSLGYNGALGAMRLTSRLTSSPSRPTYLATSASGAVALDGTARPTLFEGPGVGLAGVAGRVFYDVDADGRFGPGDLPARDVRVVVSGAPVRSDSSGTYHAWNVVPYESFEIAIDTLAFTDFSWTLLRGRTTVRATPGTFNRVDFPLVRTRELAGQLVPDSSIATVGGVTLLLTGTTPGSTTLRIVTYSDGTFYVSRVLPGRYLLTVAQSALDILGAAADPASMPVDISLAAGDPVQTLPPLHLRRRVAAAP
jgi:hypothetical protein